MTMPCERTRAVIQAREFLLELSQDVSLPESLRWEAKRLLRHYPSRREMLGAGQLEEHLTEGTIFQPPS
ncbi:BPSL0761 family protein [Halomonas sp. M4R1S46]|uniref:BPSL0761 family protein n=1 Tax=Halomonas sp. M4R1S46 TaxID=2982692 RepID=UPI0029656DE3|nr:BPSL0761 family protein [Halomonas sp. M4R1S46]